jgi:hypothetical protein
MSEKPQVQLVGLDGNAFSIMGRVRQALKKAGLEEQISEFFKEAQSGDYDNLLRVCSKYVDVC